LPGEGLTRGGIRYWRWFVRLRLLRNQLLNTLIKLSNVRSLETLDAPDVFELQRFSDE
jgi:hypothetical protein